MIAIVNGDLSRGRCASKQIAPVTRLVYDFSSELEFKQMPNGEAVAIYVGGPPQSPVHAPVYAGVIKSHPTQELATMHGESLKIVGAVPGTVGMYVVATHSGVTLAPILGKFVAQEVLGGEKVAMLARYRPERFLKA